MDYLHIKYDGGEASHHELPVRELGQALLGLDGIVNQGLYLLAYGRAPTKGARFEVRLTAQEPAAGSFELMAILREAPWVLPLLKEIYTHGGADLIKHFISYVLTRFGGRTKEADAHLDALLTINRDHLDARNQNDQQWRETVLAVVDRLAPQARQLVAPIGHGAETLMLSNDPLGTDAVIVDKPMADAIRSQKNDEVGDMQMMEIKVDGVIHHSRQLKVYSPGDEGRFINAEVRDPLFGEIPNPYADAAAAMATIKVMAKPVYRGGQLLRIYIMDIVQ